MSTSARYGPAVVALLLLIAGACPSGAGEAGETGAQERSPSPWKSVLNPEAGLLEWRYQDRPLLTYAFASNQFKPYVRALRTLRGENVLLDAPADHLHHHGLMYAIRVNGVNFWEERDAPGHEVHVTFFFRHTGRNATGRPEASFGELIHWVPDGGGMDADPARAFLVERRTLTLTVDEAQDEVALAWHSEFELGGRTNRIRLHGSDYNGLGLRLPPAWDRRAFHTNSEAAPYVTRGRRDVFPARWASVANRAGTVSAQVTLLARPRGHAGTNAFFAMTDPFTYLAATQSLDRAPLEYRAGDRFSLDYLVLVHSAARSPAQLESRYQAWAKELNPNER